MTSDWSLIFIFGYLSYKRKNTTYISAVKKRIRQTVTNRKTEFVDMGRGSWDEGRWEGEVNIKMQKAYVGFPMANVCVTHTNKNC